MRKVLAVLLLGLLGCRHDGKTGGGDDKYPALKRYAIRRSVDLNEAKKRGVPWQDYLYEYSESHGPIFNPDEKAEYAKFKVK